MSFQQPVHYAVIPVVGPDGAGKTTLAAAIAAAQAARDPRSVVPARTVEVQGLPASVLEIRAPGGVLQLVDFASAEVEARLLGSSPMSGVVLAVSALDGALPGTRDSLERARERGISRVVVALTKCDAVEDAELLDLIEMEMREMLNKYELAGDAAAVVRTAAAIALRGEHRAVAGVAQLLDAMGARLFR
jgi:elongation factor Tu